MLQIGEDVFANAIFVEFGLNGNHDFVYNGAIYGGLKNFSVICGLLQPRSGEQLTTILFDIVNDADNGKHSRQRWWEADKVLLYFND